MKNSSQSMRNMHRLNSMKMELFTEWEEREVRGVLSEMYRFTDNDKVYYVAVPKENNDNVTSWVTKYMCEDTQFAQQELGWLLK